MVLARTLTRCDEPGQRSYLGRKHPAPLLGTQSVGMVLTMLTIALVSLLSALGAALVAPPPRRRVPAWMPGLGAFCAPVLFAAILSLAQAHQELLSFAAICAMSSVVGTLLWCLRAPGGTGDDGPGTDGGGNMPLTPEPGPRGGGLQWDWDAFEADLALYVASQDARERELAAA